MGPTWALINRARLETPCTFFPHHPEQGDQGRSRDCSPLGLKELTASRDHQPWAHHPGAPGGSPKSSDLSPQPPPAPAKHRQWQTQLKRFWKSRDVIWGLFYWRYSEIRQPEAGWQIDSPWWLTRSAATSAGKVQGSCAGCCFGWWRLQTPGNARGLLR